MELFSALALSLTLGIIVGIERGWQERAEAEGGRPAGIRTFGLIGLAGGLAALLSRELGETVFGFALLALVGVLTVSHWVEQQIDRDVGVTTVIAGMVTFLLGALPLYDHSALAAAAAVITAILLSLKPLLHGWLRLLEADDWYAALKLLLISVVVIPLLPNRGYGPWGVLNPYELWWMVVLIAGISFLGYMAMKMVGTDRGLLLTGLLGGLASSTAATLSLARLTRAGAAPAGAAAAILIASTMMFPRLLLVVALLNPALAALVTLPLLAMALVAVLGSGWLWHKGRRSSASPSLTITNPFQLLPAIQFGLLLAAVMLATEASRLWLGEQGLLIAVTLAAIPDVDAIVLSLMRMSREGLEMGVVVPGVILAAAVNTLAKGVLATLIAGRALAWQLLPWLSLTIAAGGAVVILT